MGSSVCIEPGCGAPVIAKGLCWKHYQRQRRTGTTALAQPSVEERFWSHVTKTEGCWLWKNDPACGRGRFVDGEGRTVLAYRFAYEILVGPIPDGLTLDHLCLTTLCVNPDHLEPVTFEENARRFAVARERSADGRMTPVKSVPSAVPPV